MSSAELIPSPPHIRMSRDEFLAYERASETKNEYYMGEVWPMVGASFRHMRIGQNLNRLLLNHYYRTGIEVFAENMRVGTQQHYFYPDFVLLEGEAALEDAHEDTLLNPVAIIEVLSPSTESFVRGKKFGAYQAISSLREYLLVAQNEPKVEHYRRQKTSDLQWFKTVNEGNNSSFPLLEDSPVAPVCVLNLADIYERVRFDSKP